MAGQVSVFITQRHSWRRSASFCNDTSSESADTIGEGILTSNSYLSTIPSISAMVQCTDYNEEFDYSSGESSTTVLLPINKQINYVFQGCCWITLLPPDTGSEWSLKLLVNTKQRSDGMYVPLFDLFPRMKSVILLHLIDGIIPLELQ